MTRLALYSTPKRRRHNWGPEAALQYAVIEHLRLADVPGLIYFHVPNQGKRTEVEGAHLKRMGMLPGTSDLILMAPGLGAAALELKAKGEKPTPEQLAFSYAWCEAGGVYAYADNIDSALAILTRWGFIDYQRRSEARQWHDRLRLVHLDDRLRGRADDQVASQDRHFVSE